MKYEIEETSTGSNMLIRYNEDGSISSIPMEESNSDYQVYLKSLKEDESKAE